MRERSLIWLEKVTKKELELIAQAERRAEVRKVDIEKDMKDICESIKKKGLTYSHGQAHGNLAIVTMTAPRKASYAVSGPRDPSGLAL